MNSFNYINGGNTSFKMVMSGIIPRSLRVTYEEHSQIYSRFDYYLFQKYKYYNSLCKLGTCVVDNDVEWMEYDLESVMGSSPYTTGCFKFALKKVTYGDLLKLTADLYQMALIGYDESRPYCICVFDVNNCDFNSLGQIIGQQRLISFATVADPSSGLVLWRWLHGLVREKLVPARWFYLTDFRWVVECEVCDHSISDS